MNDRFFDGRKLKCFYWDGKTDYKKVKESDDALQERIADFGNWLEGGELPEEFAVQKEVGQEVEGGETAGGMIKEKR